MSFQWDQETRFSRLSCHGQCSHRRVGKANFKEALIFVEVFRYLRRWIFQLSLMFYVYEYYFPLWLFWDFLSEMSKRRQRSFDKEFSADRIACFLPCVALVTVHFLSVDAPCRHQHHQRPLSLRFSPLTLYARISFPLPLIHLSLSDCVAGSLFSYDGNGKGATLESLW